MGKAHDNKLIKERKIYDTALELFLSKGTNQTTIDDIVKNAGVAKGTFYLYFSDKHEIVEKLVQIKANELFDDAISFLNQDDKKYSGIEYLRAIVNYILDALTVNQKLMCFLHKNLSYGIFKNLTIHKIGAGKNIVENFNPDAVKNQNVLETIINVLESSGVHMKNPESTMFLVMELVSGACYNSIIFSQPMPIQEYKPYLFEAIKTLITNG